MGCIDRTRRSRVARVPQEDSRWQREETASFRVGKNGDHASGVGLPNLRRAARAPWHSGRFRRVPHWHGARLLVSSGRTLDELRTAVSRAKCALPDRARSLGDLSRAGCQSARGGRSAPLRRAGVPGFSSVWLARRRVRAVSLRRLRPRPPGPVFLQEPRALSKLRRPPDGRASRSPGRSCVPRRARAAVPGSSAAAALG